MLDLAKTPNLRHGLCQDIACEKPTEPDYITHVQYIDTNKSSAWICQDCLEQWMNTLEEYCADMPDFDFHGGYPFIP